VAQTKFKIAINGLEELKEALRRLPQELAEEAAVIVQAQAEAAAREMDAGYAAHEWTGNLRAGLIVRQDFSSVQYGARWIVRNRAKHAFIAEHGTAFGRVTDKGVSRGKMPPLNIFIPIAIKRRRMMVRLLADIVRRHGLQVTESSVMSEAA
jgi:hypothetical protein